MTFTRESLAPRAGFYLKGGDIASLLEQMKLSEHKTKTIAVDNGSPFASLKLYAWSYLNDAKLDFLRPGNLVENCYNSSSNGKFSR